MLNTHLPATPPSAGERTFASPYLLTDNSRLQEVYYLRSYCWEHSPGRDDINTRKYPNGYRDALEESSHHFISTDNSGKIIAAARLTVCTCLNDLPYAKLFEPYRKLITDAAPFLFYSRLVIHPLFRKRGLSTLFDKIRFEMHIHTGLSLGLVTVNRKREAQLAKYGFKYVDILNDPTGSFPFQDLNLISIRLATLRQHIDT